MIGVTQTTRRGTQGDPDAEKIRIVTFVYSLTGPAGVNRFVISHLTGSSLHPRYHLASLICFRRPVSADLSSLLWRALDLSGGPPEPEGYSGDLRQIIDAARRGEQSQLGILLDLYRGYLMTVAAEKLSPQFFAKVSPSDLVQETLLNATKGFAEFRGSTEAELRAWLTQILLAKTTDAHRHYGTYEIRTLFREVPLNEGAIDENAVVGGPGLVPSPSSFAHSAENVRIVSAALAKLNPEYQLVIKLRSFELLGFEEIGGRLERSADAARKLWGRAIQALAEELRSYGADFQSPD